MFWNISRRVVLGFLVGTMLHGAAAEDARQDMDDSARRTAAKSLPTLWIAGDSTVRNVGVHRGWGQDIRGFLDPEKVQVQNRAIGGRSSRTFFTEGRWDAMLGEMKEGDMVLIQFGHNDVGPLDERGKFRGSVKGIGDEIEQVKKPDGSVETVRSFGWYLKYYARSAKAKGVTVVLCSPVPHKKFEGDWKDWRPWVKACAEAEGVLYLDLAGIIAGRYAAMKPAEVEAFFADKGTHTNAAGSMFNAKAVVDGLRELPGNPLGGFWKEVR